MMKVPSITRTIIEWADEQFENIDVNDKHATLKAFSLGALHGFIDNAIVTYPTVMFAAYYWKHKAQKK